MSYLSPGRPEASAAIWSWEDLDSPVDAGPSAGSVRVRGLIQGAVGFAIAGLFLYFEHRTMATVVASITGVITLLALVSPLRAFTAIQRGFTRFGAWVGRGVSWIVLPAIFYLFFVPFGSLFRRARRDTMKRYYEADAGTYWEAASSDGARTRQF